MILRGLAELRLIDQRRQTGFSACLRPEPSIEHRILITAHRRTSARDIAQYIAIHSHVTLLLKIW